MLVTHPFDDSLADLHRRFGPGSVMKIGNSPTRVDAIPTGSLSLDLALGVGGIPRGRVTEIYGPEMSGKTTLCQHIIAQAQQRGGIAAFVDMEHALDADYAAHCGVDVPELYVSQPDDAEQALEIVEGLVRGGAAVVVVDSVAALVPRAELEGEMGDNHSGLQSRLMSQALRKLSGLVKQANTALVFTNQLRMKQGGLFGNPETTTGGLALRFYASVRLDMRRVETIKQGDQVVGSRIKVVVKKNKVAAPFRVAEFDIMFDQGISRAADLLDMATASRVVDKLRSSYAYGEQRLGYREAAVILLQEHPDLAAEIELAVRSRFNGGGAHARPD